MKIGLKDRLRKKYGLGQTWDITAGCNCDGCKAYRRVIRRKLTLTRRQLLRRASTTGPRK